MDLSTLAGRLDAIERALRIQTTATVTLDQIHPNQIVQVRSDLNDAYGGLPAWVGAVRAGRIWCNILVPHRGSMLFPYHPGALLPIGPLQHPRHRWMDDGRQNAWSEMCADKLIVE